jgi:uncharacterized membrane protein YecN with MAPEG domain
VTKAPIPSRRPGSVLGFACFAAVALLLLWAVRAPVPLLREALKIVQFWSLELCAATVAVLGIATLREIRILQRSDYVRMSLLGILALVLTLFVAPRTNRIYYDEQIYQGIGQNLADLRLAQMCNDGAVEYGRLQCFSGEYNKQPYAYPHLLSLVYRVAGVREGAAFAVNAAAMVLTAAAVYVAVLLLFSDRAAALFASLIMVLMPQQLLWSATAAVEPAASLACIAAVLAAAQFRRSRSTIAMAATVVAAAYAIQFRQESIVILPVLGLLLLPARRELLGARVWWVAVLGLVLAFIPVAHAFAVRHEGWGTSEARLSAGYVAANLRVNGPFYLADERFPAVYTALALLGLMTRSFAIERAAMLLYFLGFFGIYLLFYAGSYNFGADVRYSLMTYPPLAVLGGIGASRAAGWLQRIRPGATGRRMLAAFLGAQFLLYMPQVRATTEEAWAARADVRFARTLAPALEGNSYVLTHNPGMFHLWGINAGQLSQIVLNPAHADFLASRYSGGVYLHWNFWCNVQDPVQREFCAKALAGGRYELVAEHVERDQRYALYRLRTDGPKGQE